MPREVVVFPVTVSVWLMVVALMEDLDIAKAAILVPLPMVLMGKTVLPLPFITADQLPPVLVRR